MLFFLKLFTLVQQYCPLSIYLSSIRNSVVSDYFVDKLLNPLSILKTKIVLNCKFYVLVETFRCWSTNVGPTIGFIDNEIGQVRLSWVIYPSITKAIIIFTDLTSTFVFSSHTLSISRQCRYGICVSLARSWSDGKPSLEETNKGRESFGLHWK